MAIITIHHAALASLVHPNSWDGATPVRPEACFAVAHVHVLRLQPRLDHPEGVGDQQSRDTCSCCCCHVDRWGGWDLLACKSHRSGQTQQGRGGGVINHNKWSCWGLVKEPGEGT